MPKHVAELRDCRVILSKHLRPKLSQRLAYLPFVQLHDLLPNFDLKRGSSTSACALSLALQQLVTREL